MGPVGLGYPDERKGGCMKLWQLLLALFLLGCLPLFLPGCMDCGVSPITHRIDNVERVLMHEPYHFTFIVRNGDEMGQRTVRGWRDTSVTYVDDVPKGQTMYVDVTEKVYQDVDHCAKQVEHMEIHIHSFKDVVGAGWDHGKFGKGRTEVVQ